MLKAFCLDDKEHAHLIRFIDEYKDENGRANMSSAIRFLMQKGYEAVYGKKTVQIPYNKSKINKDEIKKEVMNEVLAEVNSKLLTNLTTAIDKLSNMPTNFVPIQPVIEEKPKEVSREIKPREIKKALPKNVEAGSLLANLLSNANK